MKLFPFAAAALALLAVHPASAQTDAKGTVDSFDKSLLDVMKNAEKLGYQGRFDKFDPVINKVYDIPLMTRISVGPQWSSLTPDQQTKVTEAFKKLSIATYASRFDGYGGESFQITGESPANGGDEIIDVYLSGTISQLANYRSEFAATLRSGGADALVDLINKKVADEGAK